MLPPDFQKRTQRLVGRPYRQNDYDAWRETFLNLPAAQNKWDFGPRAPETLTRQQFEKRLETEREERERDTLYAFIGFEEASGRMVGRASLMDISRGLFQNAYLGYHIYSPFWGQGYGRELVSATIDIAFHDLKLHRIEAGIEPDNVPSIALAESLNMRHEGLSARRLYLRGQWVDVSIYALTAEEVGIEDCVGQSLAPSPTGQAVD